MKRLTKRTGISQVEIEEISVPTCGLTSVGLRQEVLGNFTAILAVSKKPGILVPGWNGISTIP